MPGRPGQSMPEPVACLWQAIIVDPGTRLQLMRAGPPGNPANQSPLDRGWRSRGTTQTSCSLQHAPRIPMPGEQR